MNQTGNEATMLHLRVNPGDWQSFKRVAAFLFLLSLQKKYRVVMTQGPSAHGHLGRGDRFF